MNWKYNQVLGKISSTAVCLLVLFTFGTQFKRYERNGTRKLRMQKRLDLHFLNNDMKEHKSLTINTNSDSRKQHSDVDTGVEKKVQSQGNSILDYIPSVSVSVNNDKVPYISDDVTRKFLKLPNIEYQKRVAILTPIRNAESTLEQFREQVDKLTYPHELMSLFFGEDGSTDNTFEKATIIVHQLKIQSKFNVTDAVRLNISGGLHGSMNVRHKLYVQQTRRAHMALARNRLLRFALRQNKFDYILWIDSDVTELPADLVQQMLFAKSDVVATCCLIKSLQFKMKYDWNSWRETNASIKQQSHLEPDFLLLEGYNKSMRIGLPDLKSEGRVVHLDGVGGCALMIRAECHRSGLHFPEVVYKHHIETEGLAKMARDMGYQVVGLPFVEVFHRL